MKLIDQIKHHTPCESAVAWMADRDLATAWAECECGDWMLWLYARAANYDKRKAVYVAALCANDVRHMMTDERSRHAVDVAMSYGLGEATYADLDAALDAARAAADAARAAADTALDDASAATWAAARTAVLAAIAAAARAAADAAWDAARAAARTAALAAIAAAARAAARDAAWDAALRRYADLCREHLPMPIISPPAGERREV